MRACALLSMLSASAATPAQVCLFYCLAAEDLSRAVNQLHCYPTPHVMSPPMQVCCAALLEAMSAQGIP